MEKYSEYKDSGVQWLGVIPGHWKNPSFKRVCKLKSGNSSVEEFLDEEIPFIRVSDMNLPGNEIFINTSKSFVKRKSNLTSIFPIGSVIFPKRGGAILTNKRRIVKKEICCDLNIMGAIPGPEVASKFLYYYLSSKNFSELYNGSAVPQINNGDIEPLPFPLPPLDEQHSIVSYLDDKCGKIDKMLEGKMKQIELLSEFKQRIIADAVSRGLNPNVKTKATSIPWLQEIPEHWEEKRMASMFTGDVETNKDFEYKHAFKFNYGQLVPKNEIGDPEEYREVYVKYSKIKSGDILINGLNLNYDFVSQRVAYAPSDGIITSAYVVCRPRTGVNYDYYTYLFKSMDSMKLFHGMGTGIRLTLSFKELKKQMIPIPPQSEQNAVVEFIKDKEAKFNALTSKLQQEIESIKEYKQRLISDVVTGQIKVC